MENIAQVIIHGRAYSVRLFNPIDAYRFYSKWCSDRDQPKHGCTFGLVALRRCRTPSGDALESDSELNGYFRQYPQDMIPLAYEALSLLVMEFKNELERYLKEYRLLMQQMGKRPQQMKVPAGWEYESFFGRVVMAGLCRYLELREGGVSIPAVFEMFRLLDWKDYCTGVALERAEANRPKKTR